MIFSSNRLQVVVEEVGVCKSQAVVLRSFGEFHCCGLPFCQTSKVNTASSILREAEHISRLSTPSNSQTAGVAPLSFSSTSFERQSALLTGHDEALSRNQVVPEIDLPYSVHQSKTFSSSPASTSFSDRISSSCSSPLRRIKF